MKRIVLYGAMVLALFAFPAAGLSAPPISVEILYMNHGPLLPTIKEIMDDPGRVAVPDEPSVLYALTGSLARDLTETNVSSVIEYVNRLAKEFQVITLRETFRRNKALLKTPTIVDWMDKNGELLF